MEAVPLWLHPRCQIQQPELATTEPPGDQGEGLGSRPREETLCFQSKEATCRGPSPPILRIWVGRGSVDNFPSITVGQGRGPRTLAFHCPHFSS